VKAGAAFLFCGVFMNNKFLVTWINKVLRMIMALSLALSFGYFTGDSSAYADEAGGGDSAPTHDTKITNSVEIKSTSLLAKELSDAGLTNTTIGYVDKYVYSNVEGYLTSSGLYLYVKIKDTNVTFHQQFAMNVEFEEDYAFLDFDNSSVRFLNQSSSELNTNYENKGCVVSPSDYQDSTNSKNWTYSSGVFTLATDAQEKASKISKGEDVSQDLTPAFGRSNASYNGTTETNYRYLSNNSGSSIVSIYVPLKSGAEVQNVFLKNINIYYVQTRDASVGDSYYVYKTDEGSSSAFAYSNWDNSNFAKNDTRLFQSLDEVKNAVIDEWSTARNAVTLYGFGSLNLVYDSSYKIISTSSDYVWSINGAARSTANPTVAIAGAKINVTVRAKKQRSFYKW
jgi:hypothetical protein